MRRIYLLRHGVPETAPGPKRYIGITEEKLSDLGREEAAELGEWFRSNIHEEAGSFRIYTSPQERCRETAEIICQKLKNGTKGSPEAIANFHEISLGDWENRTFQEIREKYPEEYAKRGMHPGDFRTPGGETFHEAGDRFTRALKKVLEANASSASDLIIVSHAGVIRAFLTELLGKSMDRVLELPMPYCGVSILSFPEQNSEVSAQGQVPGGSSEISAEENTDNHALCPAPGEEKLTPEIIGMRPLVLLNDQAIERLYEKYQVPEHIRAHMRAVAETAEKILESLHVSELYPLHADGILDMSPVTRLHPEAIRKACLLHDLLRLKPHHAEASADAVLKEEYPYLAKLIRGHHSADMDPDGPLTDAEILFYADKRVQGSDEVGVEERFARSLSKCRTPEAIEYHDALLRKTLAIEDKIRRYNKILK